MKLVDFNQYYFGEHEVPYFAILGPQETYVPIAVYKDLDKNTTVSYLYVGNEYTKEEFEAALKERFPKRVAKNGQVSFCDWSSFQYVFNELHKVTEDRKINEIRGMYDSINNTLKIGPKESFSHRDVHDNTMLDLLVATGDAVVTPVNECYIAYKTYDSYDFRRPLNIECLRVPAFGTMLGVSLTFSNGLHFNFIASLKKVNSKSDLEKAILKQYGLNLSESQLLNIQLAYLPIEYISPDLEDNLDSLNLQNFKKYHLLVDCGKNTAQIRSLQEMHPMIADYNQGIPKTSNNVSLMQVLEY